MREATAQQGGMSLAQLQAWSAHLRKQQGLPPHITEPLPLDRIATLMRAADKAAP